MIDLRALYVRCDAELQTCSAKLCFVHEIVRTPNQIIQRCAARRHKKSADAASQAATHCWNGVHAIVQSGGRGSGRDFIPNVHEDDKLIATDTSEDIIPTGHLAYRTPESA